MNRVRAEAMLMTARGRTLLILAGLLLLAVTVGFSALLAPGEDSAVTDEHLAPDFAIALYQGPDGGDTAARLSDFFGQPLVVNFWAEWCPPCVIEMPSLQAIQEEFAETGLAVIGADVGPFGQDHDRRAQAFLARLGVTFPAGRVLVEDIDPAFHLDSVPTTVFINRHGEIHAVWSGWIDEASLREVVESLVAE